MIVKPTYYVGDKILLTIFVHKNGVPTNNFIVEKVRILDNEKKEKHIIQPTEVEIFSNGRAIAFVITDINWKIGEYAVEWEVIGDGEKFVIQDKFKLSSKSQWEITPQNRIQNFDFQWILLNKTIYFGSEEYIRIIIKEIYDRQFDVDNIECKFIHYISPYRIDETDWLPMVYKDGVLMYKINTNDGFFVKSDKWYVQVRCIVKEGELILSPLMKFSIV